MKRVALEIPKPPQQRIFLAETLLTNKEIMAGISQFQVRDTHYVFYASAWSLLQMHRLTPIHTFHLLGEEIPYALAAYAQKYNLPINGYHEKNVFWLEEVINGEDAIFSFVFETDLPTKNQLYTHSVDLAKSSQSFRYMDSFRPFKPDYWRPKGSTNKQGSIDVPVKEAEGLTYEESISVVEDWYTRNDHICNEQRRYILPQCQMIRYVITGALEAWERVVRLRTEETAQKEIRIVAEQVQSFLNLAR
jgi:hypothetical protein